MITHFTVNLPVAPDAFSRWMEDNGVKVEFCVMLGRHHVTVSWRRVLSYSDAEGMHSEEWSLSRDHVNRSVALEEALGAAIQITQENR